MDIFRDVVEMVLEFREKGGPVLFFIAGLLFLMWTLIFERIFFFGAALREEVREVVTYWENREDKRSWRARKIREALISETVMKINKNMALIKTLVAVAPMFGLLGTVTGMIAVFHIMAITGGGDPKSMAGGVSQATVPTMAGMVAALSGVFAQTYLNRIVERESALIEDRLTLGDEPMPPTSSGRRPKPADPKPSESAPAANVSEVSAPNVSQSSSKYTQGEEAAELKDAMKSAIQMQKERVTTTVKPGAKSEGGRFVDRFPPGSDRKSGGDFDDDGLL